MTHADKDPRRQARLRRTLETAPLHVTRWGDVIVWRGDGFYCESTDGRLVPSANSSNALLVTRRDVLQ